MNGSSTAASNAMMASTHTISSRVKPRCVTSFISGGCRLFEGNVGGIAAATLLAIGAIGDDVIRAMLAGRPIDVGVIPGIFRNIAALQVRPIPRGNAGRPLYQRGKSLRARRKSSGIEIKQVERAGEALQLDARGLDLGFAEIIEHTRADQAHDQADDGDHDQHLDQREALLTEISVPASLAGAPLFKARD